MVLNLFSNFLYDDFWLIYWGKYIFANYKFNFKLKNTK